MNLDYHRAIMSDKRRMEAQGRAIRATVRPGDVVVDVGAGTGILAVLAARAGAAKVYAIERHTIIQIARDVARANGVADKIECVQADVTRVELAEDVDVVMGDVIGVMGVDLNIMGMYEHIVSRYLRPGGRVIPRRIDVFFAPWSAAKLYEPAAFWTGPVAGVDMSACRPLVVNNPLSVLVPPEGRLGAHTRYWTLDVANPKTQLQSASHEIEIQRAATMHGIAGWFRAQLAEGIEICTSPDEPPMVWRQGFLPIDVPIEVEAGDILDLEVTATPEPAGVLLGWRGSVARNGVLRAEFVQHEFLGSLYDLENVARP